MSGNARFHDKLHRANHHTLSTGGLLDSAYDPIASPEHPFRGDFILSGSLSALGDVIANNLKIASEIIIDGNTTTQNQKIVGNLQLAKQNYGGATIYAINPTSKPIDRTLSINYENGVYISDNLYIGSDLYGGNAYLTDLSATGVLYGNLPTVGSVTPTTEDISNAYLTLSTNSGYWNDASNWVSTNSSDMVVQNLVVTNNITALGSTTLVDLSTSTSDSLCVVNVGLAVPALYGEVVLGSNPILELKHTGDGPILSAQSGGSTFLINNSGWVGIGGEPSTQLDIYPQSSTQGANVKLGGNLAKDFFINIENDELSIAHDNTAGGLFENAIKITHLNQLYVNADTSWNNNFKLYVKNGISNFTNSTTACHTILENATYNDVYTYNNGSFVANGANTRIFNLSGENISPLSGIDANYPGWSVSLYPYVGGSVSNGFGALGQGGVASINLGYEGLQTIDNLRGSITFNTLCAISGAPTGIPERMRITPGGNVGIGINAPTTKLHILGDSDKDINFYTNGTIGAYNKLDPTYAYGFVSVNREHTLFGGNLWLSGETALPVYKKGTNNKAAAGILIKNTNGAGVIPVAKFVYALDTDDASYTVTDSMVISGTNVSIPGDLYLTGTFYGNAAYRSLTANWQSTYNTVNSNSATNWSYQGNDLKALSGNWQSTYSTVSTLSANWESTYNTVNSNSATNWSYQGNDLKALSGNWESTYNTVNSNSATNWSYQGNDLKALSGNWQSTYNTVSTLSAIWGGAMPTDHTKWDSVYDTTSGLSANWQSTYNTVNSNSATNWSYQGNDLKALSGNWESTYNTVNSNSASWSSTGLTTEDVEDTVNTLLSAGKGISIRYDDINNKLELSTTANLSTSTGLTPGYYALANSTNRLEDGSLRQSGPSIFLSNNDATFYTTGSNSHIYTTGSNSQIYTNSGHIYTNSGNISSRTGNLFLSAGNVLAPIGIVSAASANFVNLSSNYVRLQSYSETSISLTPASLSPYSYNLDLSKGTVFQITLQANIIVGGGFALENIPPGVNSFLLIITQNGTGGWGISSWLVGKTLKWSGGAPTVTSTANATDMYSFMSVDGNTWYGSVAGKNFV